MLWRGVILATGLHAQHPPIHPSPLVHANFTAHCLRHVHNSQHSRGHVRVASGTKRAVRCRRYQHHQSSYTHLQVRGESCSASQAHHHQRRVAHLREHLIVVVRCKLKVIHIGEKVYGHIRFSQRKTERYVSRGRQSTCITDNNLNLAAQQRRHIIVERTEWRLLRGRVQYINILLNESTIFPKTIVKSGFNAPCARAAMHAAE